MQLSVDVVEHTTVKFYFAQNKALQQRYKPYLLSQLLRKDFFLIRVQQILGSTVKRPAQKEMSLLSGLVAATPPIVNETSGHNDFLSSKTTNLVCDGQFLINHWITGIVRVLKFYRPYSDCREEVYW